MTRRLRAQTAKIEGHFVQFPEKAPWLDAYLLELTTFPNAIAERDEHYCLIKPDGERIIHRKMGRSSIPSCGQPQISNVCASQ
jgi:hypothetical protein